MKRNWKKLLLSSCMTLIVGSSIVLLTPIITYGRTCSITCEDGGSASCSGTSCTVSAENGGGCTSTTSGGQTITVTCN
jgi:hypothetical protein